LVLVKKNQVDKSERDVQNANKELQKAKEALDESYKLLQEIKSPTSGNISQMQASRMIFNFQREKILENKKWIDFTQNQLTLATQKLKEDTIEYEKFKYLELQEKEKILKEIKIAQAKELDEIALMTFKQKEEK